MKLDVKPFIGQHCETTATGTLLNQLGIFLSEPFLFGLGEGLSFVFWKMKSSNMPFIGGRIKPDRLTQNITKNLGLKLDVKETSSKVKAWESVKSLLDSGKAVGLKLDCYHLDYFTNPIHFAGHYVAIIGYENRDAFLVDTDQQGCQVSTSLESLALARSEKGPMSSKNLFYTIEKEKDLISLEMAVVKAIQNNAVDYLSPSIKNMQYRGIEKVSEEVIKWFDGSQTTAEDFGKTAILMERAGTGGAIFRNLYCDFLNEAYVITKNGVIRDAYQLFVEIANGWTQVIELFQKVADTKDRRFILAASEIMKNLSGKEKEAMTLLMEI